MPDHSQEQPPEKPEFAGANASQANSHQHRVLVWDFPTRLFHWMLVILVIISFVTAKMGGTVMQYHEWSGVAILVLILFRLNWGFIGGSQARFTAFVRGPRAVFAYVSNFLHPNAKPYLGHNPLGGWSILAMLAILSLQVATGLFANDDILTEGPLFHLVSKETSDWLTRIHHLNQNILVALIAIHVFAVGFYLVKKGENLVTPMLTGYKSWHERVSGSGASAIQAMVLIAVFAAGIYYLLYR